MVSSLEHFVCLGNGMWQDLRMWSNFLRHWNEKFFCLEDHLTSAPDLSLYTDASGAYCYGAYYKAEWFRGG